MIIVQILIVLISTILIFIIAPSIVMYLIVFGRKDRPHIEKSDLTKTYYAPFREELMSSYRYLQVLPTEQISISSSDGLMLYGEYKNGGFSKTAIFCHGYGGTPYHQFSPQAKDLYQAGFNLLFPIQRAHNESEGKHTTLGIKEADDLLIWIDWVRKHSECKEILLYGMSMGCSAIEYASDRLEKKDICAMVLDCGFTSPWDQLTFDAKKHHIPSKVFLPLIALYAKVRIGIDIKADTRPALSKTSIPALFFHGTEDQTVPLSQGLQNFEACASEKERCIIDGAGHTLCYLYGGEKAVSCLDQFLMKYFTIYERNQT